MAALALPAIAQQANLGAPGMAGIMPRPESPPPGGQNGQAQNGQPPRGQPPGGPQRPGGPTPTLTLPAELRSVDGSGNNVADPLLGKAGEVFGRLAPAAYGDAISTPAGENRPSARAVSNALIKRPATARPNRAGASDFLWNWGQFVDHDLDETPTAVPAEAFPIAVPAGDAEFDPTSTGTVTMGLNRSAHEEIDGVREQKNAITAFIDGSQVYGSDETRATALRALDGTGRMKVTPSANGDLLPLNTAGIFNVPPGPTFYLAGDVRVNEQPGLLTLQTLFVREHNHWAGVYKAQNPTADDNAIYQFARVIVGAEIQAITYREFLPLLLGPRAIPPYRGYQASVDPSIANEFATAAYRFGHSTVSANLLRVNAQWQAATEGPLSLREQFFNIAAVTDFGLDNILRGMAAQRCEELDEWIVEDLRSFLFGAPGAGGLDLASLNIQRGRDHGLPGFNAMRQALGLPAATTFREINPNPVVIAELTAAYSDINDMDLWAVGLAERDVPGSMLGATLHRIVVDQFRRTRDGDRFWYQKHLSPALVRLVDQQSLATIIRRNTGIRNELPANPWIAKPIRGTPPARR